MEPPTAREVIARLERDGWAQIGCTGDHRKFRKDGRLVVVPGRLGEHLKRGTWASGKQQAGW